MATEAGSILSLYRHSWFSLLWKLRASENRLFFIVRTESKCKYICRVYHQLSQYIAKWRQFKIDLCKSHLVTIEHPRNHSLSQHWIVFAIIEKYIGIVRNINFVPHRTLFSNHIKLHKNHNLNHFVPMHILLRRLSPQPPDPNTIGKLRLSSFCM